MFRKTYALKKKPDETRIKKNQFLAPEIDSSDSESDDMNVLPSQEKQNAQISNSDSSDSDSDDDITDLPPSQKLKKHVQVSNSDSSEEETDDDTSDLSLSQMKQKLVALDSSSDSSDAESDDQEQYAEDTDKKQTHKGAKAKSEKTLKERKTSLKRRSGKELNLNAVESDSEPEVIKKKKVAEPWTSHCDEDDEEYTAIKEELSHMSFEELQKLRDRLGVKVYNQVVRRGKDKPHESSTKQKFSRENKNRPMEMSSKRRVSIYREVIPVKKKVIRDPRFDDLSGNFNEAIFRSSYAFVDDIKKKEKEKLTKQLKKTKNAEKKQELKFLINRMNQRESADQQKQKRKELEKEWKKQELSRVQDGKNPYFLKKGDLRKLELAERFKELKKTGKLDKYLGKKRKKNASKEKKKLPSS